MASKAKWRETITYACKKAGTYRDFFDPVIETLAEILHRRDTAEKEFKASGGKLLIVHTNKAGAGNIEQNPAVRLINDLNRDALAYWRDLGLTPAGLKKIDEQAMKQKKKSALADALRELGG